MVEVIPNLSNYLTHNIMGSNQANTWNVLPAVLTTWSNLLANQGNKTQYELYKEQARSYVETARANADLIKKQGEIALRSMRQKHTLERGNDVVRIAARGGNMSGSNLDVAIRKEKIRKMDETVLKANYNNQAMLEMVNGYRQAGNVYGTLRAKASADKWLPLVSILKGVETYVGLQVRDAKVIEHMQTKQANIQEAFDIAIEDQITRYGVDTFNRVFSDSISDNTSTKINAYENQQSTVGSLISQYVETNEQIAQ